jgi:hypothetical protein
VREAYTVRIVGVEGLRFGATAGTGRGIPAVPDAHVAAEFDHVVLLKHVLDEAVVLAQVQAAAFGRDDAGSVLTAVLQDREAVKEHLIDLIKNEIIVWLRERGNVRHLVLHFIPNKGYDTVA